MEWLSLLSPLAQVALVLGALAIILIATCSRKAARNMILFLRDLRDLLREPSPRPTHRARAWRLQVSQGRDATEKEDGKNSQAHERPPLPLHQYDRQIEACRNEGLRNWGADRKSNE